MAMFLVDMVVIKYDMILCWSHTLVHSRKIYSPSNFRFIQKTKNKTCPYNNILLPKINLEHLEAPGLYDTNFNTLSIQTPRGQELVGHIKKE